MPPPGHEPFLHAICTDPDDDTARLVYADWLDENGDPARAEFIRLQVLRASLKTEGRDTQELKVRDIKLRQRYEALWRRELPADVHPNTWQRFWRGFVSGATANARYLVRGADTLFAATPVQFVHATRLTNELAAAVGGLTCLRRVHGLTVSDSLLGDGWTALFAGGNLANLQWLEVRLDQRSGLSEVAARALARAPEALAQVHVRGAVTSGAAPLLAARFGLNVTWDRVRG